MADAGLFIGWGAVARGREKEAVDLFNEIVEYYGRLQEEGDIESFEPVILEPHGGDLSGFVLVRGESEKLAAIRVSDEFTRYSIRAALVVDGFGVVGAELEGRLQENLGFYMEQVAAIA